MPYISSLRLRQFRSYDDFAIELSPEVNIVIGPNASGKTNLLEAVLLLCGGSTYRASTADVVMHNKDWSRIDALLNSNARILKLENYEDKIKKKYVINDTERQRLRFEDIIPIVLFEPENMRLLTGSPDLRREFLDDIISLIDPRFREVKKQYLRVLSQRNKLLKNYKQSQSQLFVWNIRLSELGGYIVSARINLINSLNDKLSEIYSEIASKKTDANINYISNIPIQSYESSLLKKLEDTVDLDLERGFTGNGPHREDFNIVLNNSQAKTSASRGETRTLVLSLKLLEVEMLGEKRNKAPLVLLDDVFSELDGSRRRTLTRYLKNTQTIITTTDADIIAKDFAQHANTIMLG